MSDQDNLQPPPPAPPPEEKQAQPEARPEPSPGPPPTLEAGQALQPGPRLRDLDKEIESELEAAMGGLSDKELYGEPAQQGRPAPSEAGQGRKKGKVISVHGADVFVDVPGGRSQGVLPLMQFPDGPPAPGTEVEVHIEGYDPANGLLLLSRQGAAVEADWSSVTVGMTVEGRVTATNKGGLSVDVNGIRGFMPISQIDLYRVDNAEQFVNQRLVCLVTEVDKAEHNLIVSRRALLEKEREEARAKLWQELAEGQVRSGVVRSVRDFGAFVDLGGTDGLLHISEMSWKRVKDANEVVQQGQTLQVVVLKVDREHRKVSLGLKQLTASPWDNAEARYPVNHIVPGKITRLMDFGAFVELEPGIEGLIHISELSPQRVRRVGDIVQPGQEVQVMVLRVDPAQRKISLSLKAALPREPEATEEEEDEADDKPRRPRNITLRGGLGDH
ncbi:MAG TPA: S1 RNA-binding domain-containing protein [Gemmataceae bacterium]|jgi:small subunit ribosomal protein S1|nr:S1 RNA-binding domain-containing protein [Gemmataceae bacterium]